MADVVVRTVRNRGRCSSSFAGLLASALLLAIVPATGHAQTADAMGEAAASVPAVEDPSINNTLDAAEADSVGPPRRLISWNEYEGPYFTLRVGAFFLWEYSGYSQDDSSEGQLALNAKDDLRDFRLILRGRFKFAPRFSYTVGYMYEKSREEWNFRQTGIMIDVPELLGSIFIGRTKEGFSTSKLTSGTLIWTGERAAINDALFPILAGGIKWSGYVPSGRFVYILGWYNDTRTETQSFNKNDSQFTARAVWLPFSNTGRDDLLHLVVQGRFAASDDGFLQYRSKPEAYLAQSYAIDTGRFPADRSTTLGLEAYYRRGPLIVGSEYYFNWVDLQETNNPLFHGGEIFAAYLLTGETRSYNARGSYFERVSPAQTVFEGGIGAWEVVVRYSYADLDSETIHGGKFWRITPMVNWYLTDNVRLEFVSGYSMLDRFGTRGSTLYFLTRLQLEI